MNVSFSPFPNTKLFCREPSPAKSFPVLVRIRVNLLIGITGIMHIVASFRTSRSTMILLCISRSFAVTSRMSAIGKPYNPFFHWEAVRPLFHWEAVQPLFSLGSRTTPFFIGKPYNPFFHWETVQPLFSLGTAIKINYFGAPASSSRTEILHVVEPLPAGEGKIVSVV